ncbi:MAG: TlyA family RNA methyltransferase [Desulfobacterales bacterium]
MKTERQRIDLLLVERGFFPSRERAQAAVLAGLVRVDGVPVGKPGLKLAPDAAIEVVSSGCPYVSRGGLKLEAAIRGFALKVEGRVCLDVGASTGGFTDCLLQHGAARVYAVDVGYGQLAWRLRCDPRVIVIERTNARHLGREKIPEPIDLATIDVSFISLRIVVPAVLPLLQPHGRIAALVKPQFEVGRGLVGKGGVVRDPALHARVLSELQGFFRGLGLSASEPLSSPIAGPKGNREFFLLLQP